MTTSSSAICARPSIGSPTTPIRRRISSTELSSAARNSGGTAGWPRHPQSSSLAVTAGATSIAAAGTHHTPVHVSGPDADETGPATTSTTAPASPTTVVSPALAPTHSRGQRPAPSAAVGTPTTVTETPTTIVCSSPPTVVDDSSGTFAPQADGSIIVTFQFAYDARRKKLGWALDDGTAGFGTLTKTYTPDQFGPHSFVEWSVDATTFTYVDCPTRHNFTVGSVPTTTTVAPETTTTTIPPPVP